MNDRKRILLVEDTASHRKLYASWLAIGGYETTTLTDEREAQGCAERSRPDAIIVDIRLPYLSGLDVIEALKASPATRDIPVLALTVLDSRSDEDACYAAGADRYVTKPTRIEPFLASIANLIG